MGEQIRQGPSATRGVNEADRPEIEALIRRCAQADGTDPKLVIRSPAEEVDSVDCAFLFHERGALIGYFAFDGTELSGLVDPAQRRRGVGRTLLEAALSVARLRGLSTVTLITEEIAPVGAAFALALGAKKAFSEHRMAQGATVPGPPPPPDFRLRPADLDDLDLLVHLMGEVFDEPAAQVRVSLRKELTTPGERFHLAFLGDAPIGCFKALFAGPRVFLHAFGVVPLRRRQGLARVMLAKAAEQLRGDEGEGARSLALEVETHNLGALALYRAAGFRVTTTYGYHALSVPG